MTESSRLGAVLDALRGARLAVIGDVMLDRFLIGTIERVSPEDPVPVVRVEREDAMPGGGANVACNLAALGVQADVVGVIGDDAAGGNLAAKLAAMDGITPHLITEAGRATTEKARIFGGARQIVRTDRETTEALAEVTLQAVLAAGAQAMSGADAVIVSDYVKGVVHPSVWDQVIRWASKTGKPVIADPKRSDFGRYRGATVLTPNLAELALASGAAVAGEGQVVAAARAAMELAEIGAMVVTRGRLGISVVPAAGEPLHLAAHTAQVFDVSGAGDTVVAALAAALATGADLGDAARLANAAAGVVVGKVGTAVPHSSEVLAALSGTDTKITALAPALERIQRWRDGGETIAFTNGCFDLVHPGHVSLLTQARAAADRLVVGLNTDTSVRLLKGEGRPVQNETARAAVLASFGAVDMVILFAEETPVGLIEAIRPEVLVKGADYTLEQVVGGEFVRSYGGRVVLADLAPGESSSGLVTRIGALNRQAGE